MSRSSPRVGDGFIRLDETGEVTFASPNAISAYHRMGLAAERTVEVCASRQLATGIGFGWKSSTMARA